MLKITDQDSDPNHHRLKLEGQLAGDWVGELERCSRQCLAARDRLTLDMSGVDYVEDLGARLLLELQALDVVVVNCSAFVAERLRTERKGE